MLKTVQSDEITVAGNDGMWTDTNAKGNVADITLVNVMQSNGVMLIIEKVLTP
ncbi:MAG: hypothetical protein ABIO17_05720 [Pseudoxanthomonas sp.]